MIFLEMSPEESYQVNEFLCNFLLIKLFEEEEVRDYQDHDTKGVTVIGKF